MFVELATSLTRRVLSARQPRTAGVTQRQWRQMLATPRAHVPARQGSLEQHAAPVVLGTSITPRAA